MVQLFLSLLVFLAGVYNRLWACKEIQGSSDSQAHPLQVGELYLPK